MRFKDKHVFITGGSTGLGEALAEKLYNSGAWVTIIARSKPNLQKASEKISKSGKGKIQHYSFDLNNPDINDVIKLIDQAEDSFGPIDYLF